MGGALSPYRQNLNNIQDGWINFQGNWINIQDGWINTENDWLNKKSGRGLTGGGKQTRQSGPTCPHYEPRYNHR